MQDNIGNSLLARRKKWAVWGLMAYMLLTALFLLGELFELAGIIDMNSADISPLTGVFVMIYLANFPVVIGCIVLVAMWIYRAHASLQEMGHELEFTPGWAVGWYFIPFANLIKPYQAMKELWATSLRQTNDFGDEAPTELNIWWGLWIVGGIVNTVSVRIASNAGPEGQSMALILGAIGSAMGIGAGYYLIGIIRDITHGQDNGAGLEEVFS